MRISRDDRSIIANWWFTVDKTLVVAILVLMGAGIVMSLAASPGIAVRRGLPAYYYVERHIIFAALGAVVMLAVSLLSPTGVRRVALLLGSICLLLLIAVLLIGVEVNGARRWLRFAGYSLQPSEFFKPAFAVSMAWLFSLKQERYQLTGVAAALALYVVSAGLLVIQPDIGQAVLISLVWGALFFLSGRPIRWALGFGALGLAALGLAYLRFAHVKARIDRFIFPGSGDNYQTERAMSSFIEGGFFGRGPGEGTIKTALPDAHSDFIFAVMAEEYGILACLVLLGLYAFVVLRALISIWHRPDAFARNAVAGLALLLALQVLINMAVNVGLLPAKGMTLPFISAGGSSALALALAMGMILALTRRRPGTSRHKMPRFTASTAAAGPASAGTGMLDDRYGDQAGGQITGPSLR